MSKEIKSISLGAAGFNGLNTMDSPLQVNVDFADTANNAVIDNYGRLAARKGFTDISASNTLLGGYKLRQIEAWDNDGTEVLFGVGNQKIFRMDTTTDDKDTLTDITMPVTQATTNTNEWQIVPFNQKLYFFHKGLQAVMMDSTNNAVPEVTGIGISGGLPLAGTAIAAYGRLWAGDIPGEEGYVYWSNDSDGDSWNGVGSGNINLDDVWPHGSDKVVGLAAHNNRLVIFGENSFLVYSGADNPATMALEDAVSGTGCAFRDSIQHTGEDIIWCSYTGIKSLSRTVLQNTLPEGDLTVNVRRNIQNHIKAETIGVKSVFSHEEMCYLITFESAETTYYIDFKSTLPDQTRKVTIWPSSPFTCFHRGYSDAILYTGNAVGLGKYAGYKDSGENYRFQYYGPAFDFGDASRTKILKKISPTIVGGTSTETTVYWGYGFSGTYESEVLTLTGDAAIAEYNIAQFGIGQYTAGISIVDEAVNTTGSGEVVRIGIGADINGSEFSLQQVRVQVLMGRIV